MPVSINFPSAAKEMYRQTQFTNKRILFLVVLYILQLRLRQHRIKSLIHIGILESYLGDYKKEQCCVATWRPTGKREADYCGETRAW
jgi:hypothetical protein